MELFGPFSIIGFIMAFVVALGFGMALTWAVVMGTVRMAQLLSRRFHRAPYHVERQRRRRRASQPFVGRSSSVVGDNVFSHIGSFCIRAIACFILLVFISPLLLALLPLAATAYEAVLATFPWSVFLLILVGRRLYIFLSRSYRNSRSLQGAPSLLFFRRKSSYPLPTTDDVVTDGIEILEVRVDNEAVCRVCGTDINGDGVLCRRCHTPHHHDCWHYVGRCSTYACGERRYVKSAPPPALKPPPDEQPPSSHWQNMNRL
jgi:ribosomal protein L40E